MTCIQNLRKLSSTLLRKRLCSVALSSFTTTSNIRRCDNIVSVAIVGSGPSGCYTAKYLKASQQHELSIDVLDRLPTPFGLVRSGVAPDHPEVKNVQNDFSALFQQDDISFYGNVTVGKDISLQELREMYDVVVLSYGCESDRKLGIPGEDSLSGVLSAREFVAWYNGHPDFMYVGPIVTQALRRGSPEPQLSMSVENANVVVIGHGNVALDCARILAKGSPGLVDTDISSLALPILGNGAQSTTIVGRRGHVQGAFTIKELRELSKLDEEGHQASFVVSPDELDLGMTESSIKELEGPSGRPKSRIDALLRTVASNPTPNNRKQVALRFLLNPCSFESDEKDPTSLGAVICERTGLQGGPGQQKSVGTGEYVKIPAQLALVSVGYKGVAVPGLDEHLFDSHRGLVVHTHGKVADAQSGLGGLYVAGWLKRGPSGIIGTNITDAKDTVSSIMKDLENHVPKTGSETRLADILKERQVNVVDWEAYQRIDEFERKQDRKRSTSQPREKVPTYEGLLHAACGTFFPP